MTSFPHGSTIAFRASCKDVDGNSLVPTKATLTLSYQNKESGSVVTRSFESATPSFNWDSSVATDTWPVTWQMIASNATSQVVDGGKFTLTAA